jgi:3D (Asp-Asp-Asp) domain-containing protein
MESLGSDWTITFYTDGEPGVDRVTSIGADVQEGRTVAVDPSIIAYGSEVYIPELDMWLIAEDCGGAIKGHRLDVFVEAGNVPDYGVIRGAEVLAKKDLS